MSKKQTVGYRYSVGIHLILCNGVADTLHRIMVDEKKAWQRLRITDVDDNINIDEPNLFGGETREGGVSGLLDVEKGKPDQGVNQYLQLNLGDVPVPSFRGVVGIVLRGMYIGTNPYLKKWQFRIQRLHLTSDDIEQWHNEKAGIFIGQAEDLSLVHETDYFHFFEYIHDTPIPDDFEPWLFTFEGEIRRGPFGWSEQGNQHDGSGNHVTNFPGEDDFAQVIQPSFPPPPPSEGEEIQVPSVHESRVTFELLEDLPTLRVYSSINCTEIRVYLDRELEPVYRSSGGGGIINTTFEFFLRDVKAGEHTLNFLAIDASPEPFPFNVNYLGVRVVALAHGYEAMNPIHIIRECLTDKNWGMGYDESSIDDDSFMASADIMHDIEEVGLCLRWEKQESIEKFVEKVKRHINAELYVDRITGLFTIKLIRPDYNANTIPVLNESNTTKVTNFSRTAFGELTNSITVNYYDMDIGNTSTVTVQDIALAAEQGNTIATTIEYNGFPNTEMASKAAQRDLVSLSTPLIGCTIYTSAAENNFNLGSVFKLSWKKYGVDNVVMRVTNANFGDGKNNIIKMECVQDVFTSPSKSLVPNIESLWEDPAVKPLGIPKNVIQYVELPYYELIQTRSPSVVDNAILTNPYLGYAGAAVVKTENGIYANMHTATSGLDFKEIGIIDYCPGAILDLLVNETQKTIKLGVISGDIENAPVGTWFQIDDELMSIQSESPNDGDWIDVKRGLLDTVPSSHEAGAIIVFWDEWLRTDPTEYVEGENVYLKVTNITPLGESPIETAATKTLGMNSRAASPYPPGNVTINGDYFPKLVEGDLDFVWASRNRLFQTSGIHLDWYEGDVTPEVGTTYTAATYALGSSPQLDLRVLIWEEAGIVDTFVTAPAIVDQSGNFVATMTTQREGLDSYQEYVNRFYSTVLQDVTMVDRYAYQQANGASLSIILPLQDGIKIGDLLVAAISHRGQGVVLSAVSAGWVHEFTSTEVSTYDYAKVSVFTMIVTAAIVEGTPAEFESTDNSVKNGYTFTVINGNSLGDIKETITLENHWNRCSPDFPVGSGLNIYDFDAPTDVTYEQINVSSANGATGDSLVEHAFGETSGLNLRMYAAFTNEMIFTDFKKVIDTLPAAPYKDGFVRSLNIQINTTVDNPIDGPYDIVAGDYNGGNFVNGFNPTTREISFMYGGTYDGVLDATFGRAILIGQNGTVVKVKDAGVDIANSRLNLFFLANNVGTWPWPTVHTEETAFGRLNNFRLVKEDFDSESEYQYYWNGGEFPWQG